MPANRTKGTKPIFIELPIGLHWLLDQKRKEDRRSIKETVVLLLEKALGVTPKDYAGLAEEKAEPAPEPELEQKKPVAQEPMKEKEKPQRGRGRPKKGKP